MEVAVHVFDYFMRSGPFFRAVCAWDGSPIGARRALQPRTPSSASTSAARWSAARAGRTGRRLTTTAPRGT